MSWQYHPDALYSQDKGQTLEMIKRTPLEYQPGSKHAYSDVDYMLLRLIAEPVTGQPLDHYIEESIYRLFGLTHTVFNPLLRDFRPQQVAVAESSGSTRDGVIHFPNIHASTLWGQVHDEKAFYSVGGVSEYVGLFSNTGDIAVLIQTTLNGGGYDDVQLSGTGTVRMFTTSSKEDTTFGLGWHVNGNVTMALTFGTLASLQTYGHTGWTGAVTVVDPMNHMAIVILSNKPHSPAADPQKNSNMFESGQPSITTYDWVVNQVYTALKQK